MGTQLGGSNVYPQSMSIHITNIFFFSMIVFFFHHSEKKMYIAWASFRINIHVLVNDGMIRVRLNNSLGTK